MPLLVENDPANDFRMTTQSRFVGDVGSFCKLGLLRWLCGRTAQDGCESFRLAIVPMSATGSCYYRGSTAYLEETEQNQTSFGACDEELWKTLMSFASQNVRDVALSVDSSYLLENGLFPPDTFVGSQLAESLRRIITDPLLDGLGRMQARHYWTRMVTEAVFEYDLVFVDPDTGIVSRTAPMQAINQGCMIDELTRFRGLSSLVVYQHLEFRPNVPFNELAQDYLSTIERTMKLRQSPFALLCYRGAPSVYLIMPAKEHYDTLLRRAHSLTESVWGRHFQLIGDPSLDGAQRRDKVSPLQARLRGSQRLQWLRSQMHPRRMVWKDIEDYDGPDPHTVRRYRTGWSVNLTLFKGRLKHAFAEYDKAPPANRRAGPFPAVDWNQMPE